MYKPPKKFVILIVLLIALGFLVNLLWVRQPFRYAGTLEATKVDIITRLSAKITALKVYEGDHVKEGTLLGQFDCDDYKNNADLSLKEFRRYQSLVQRKAAAPETLDTYENKMQDDLLKVKWCTLYSPTQGTVLSRYHEPGEWLNAGTKVLTLANIKDIWAYIYVPQPMIVKLSPGMKLKGYLPELNDREFEGTILKINDEAEFTPKNVQTRQERERLVFGVKVSFKDVNETEVLKPGMTIEVELPE